jgi:hypothetical protein
VRDGYKPSAPRNQHQFGRQLWRWTGNLNECSLGTWNSHPDPDNHDISGGDESRKQN